VERAGNYWNGRYGEVTMATTQANKELVQRFVSEVVNGRNYDLAVE